MRGPKIARCSTVRLSRRARRPVRREAITFGDSNDPNSAMMKRRTDNKGRIYTMLPEFNALPAITYLRDLYQEKGKA